MYDRIMEICERKGISKKTLEDRLGLGNGAISKWKTSCPKADTLAKVAIELDVSMDYLCGIEENEKTAPGEGGGLDDLDKALLMIIHPLSRESKLALLAGLKSAQEVKE